MKKYFNFVIICGIHKVVDFVDSRYYGKYDCRKVFSIWSFCKYNTNSRENIECLKYFGHEMYALLGSNEK